MPFFVSSSTARKNKRSPRLEWVLTTRTADFSSARSFCNSLFVFMGWIRACRSFLILPRLPGSQLERNEALPYLAGKSSTTTLHRRQCGERTKTKKEEQGLILWAFFLRNLCVLCDEKDLPGKEGRTRKELPCHLRDRDYQLRRSDSAELVYGNRVNSHPPAGGHRDAGTIIPVH